MIVALHLFGHEVAVLQIGNGHAEVDEDDSPGDCTTYPVGFYVPEVPADVVVPDRDPDY